MSTEIGKTPFLRLLLPVITGIIICSCFPEFSYISKQIAGISGLLLILISLFLRNEQSFRLRWMFGAGAFLFILSLTQLQFHKQEQDALFNFSESTHYYIGTITDIPKVKPKTIACNVKINDLEEKNVILYIQQSDKALHLEPGDEIVFMARMQPFKNFDNPDNFDYPRYMKIKGYSGSAYVPSEAWEKTGRQSSSIIAASQRFRIKALNYYKKFELNDEAYAFISALTLGYKEDLTESLQEAFRVSGTAHVLAVSGLHVGIIYIVINLLFYFPGKQGISNIFRQLLIILALWAYVFVAGMSASVVRAAIMLSINCLANMFYRRGFTLNTLSAAAFFILIYRPFYLFDVSFQMSFGAVFAILFFMPKFKALYNPANKFARYIYNLSAISLSAQLGVFALVLFYFGTFPTYFFITNLMVVPLAVLIIYSVVPLIILSALSPLKLWIIDFLNTIFQWIVKTVIEITFRIVHIAETLPFAQFSNINITFFQLILLIIITFSSGYWLFNHKSKPLIVALSTVLVLLLTTTYTLITK
ncbi:MAG: ComEC/Rec2 family competence protein [Fermentimonas sp.]|nr:ComEC/Rec2 family competence protein [Fermentimonas sp.]